MNYISTRGKIKPIPFSEAVLMGLASDGGLLLPEVIPDFRDRLSELSRLDYRELCCAVMQPFVDFSDEDLTDIVSRSYEAFTVPEVVRIKEAGPYTVLELFHGPTLAFKDIALQFLGNVFEKVLSERGGSLNILAATSGDTGSAAIQGVRNRNNLKIFVMHPAGRVSRIQELQMTSVLDDNVFNIAIDGTFDDCQSLMKSIFSDLEFKKSFSLGTVNSINWARVLAQIVYYFHAAFRVMERTGAGDVSFSVPTGNFGDIFAGYMAYRMGLPVNKLILATNSNDILARFFGSGDYSCGEVVPTVSPSMDIQVASNFERYLYYRCGSDPARLSSVMAKFAQQKRLDSTLLDDDPDDVIAAGRATDEETLSTITEVWHRHQYLLDPHTAVGWKVAGDISSSSPVICLATAHPAKFPDALPSRLMKDAAKHPVIESLTGSETRCSAMNCDIDELKKFISNGVAD